MDNKKKIQKIKDFLLKSDLSSKKEMISLIEKASDMVVDYVYNIISIGDRKRRKNFIKNYIDQQKEKTENIKGLTENFIEVKENFEKWLNYIEEQKEADKLLNFNK